MFANGPHTMHGRTHSPLSLNLLMCKLKLVGKGLRR